MCIKKVVILFLLIISGYSANAQTSIFQDSKGESAFKVSTANALILNTQDQNISLGLSSLKKQKIDTVFNRYGINLKVGTNEGVTNLKNSDGFLLDGELGLYFGKKTTTDPKDSLVEVKERYISANFIVDRNKFYDVNNGSDEFTFNETNLGWEIEAGQFGYKGNFLYGFGLNFGQGSNIKDLKTNTITQLVDITNNDSTRVIKEESAYDISSFGKNLFSFNLNGDLALLLNRKASTQSQPKIPPLYATIHFRLNTLETRANPQFNPAIGFYTTKKGAPRNIVGGINIQLMDAFNFKKSDDNAWKRTLINLTAGYQF